MNKKHIQDLLAKYFEGETSLREEKELKRFFRRTALLPEEWEPYRQMFTFFKTERLRTMPVKDDIQKKKNIYWLIATGISLAATVLILLSIFIPATKTQLTPLAMATKNMDTFYSKKEQPKKAETTKPVKQESPKTMKTKPVPVRKILSDDSSTILASGKKENYPAKSVTATMNDAFAPLENMKAIDDAMDKFKYFALMDKYLPAQDLSSIIRDGK